MGFPIVFFDKCIGRKRNVDGGVLAGLSSSDGRPKRDFGGTTFFQVTVFSGRKAVVNVCLGLVKSTMNVVIKPRQVLSST
jgi:hypothetical protein